jgi:outer membrane protein OmpA-like peptidoglycan-associated protein
LLGALAAALMAAGCASVRSSSARGGSGRALVVLLPDADTGVAGRARATNPSGSVDLDAAGDSVLVIANRQPGLVTTMSDREVDRVFGRALAAMPPPLRHFTLYFKFDSNELTDESRAQLPEVVREVRGRTAPDVAIIGHTDSVGTPSANFQLALRRSVAVSGLLIASGLDPALVETRSHGEADPLIRTPNETAEPRNRRVEITVR